MHLYITVPCKTPNCGVAHILMYLGEKGKVPEVTDHWIPYPLMIECPECGRTHDYSGSETDFRQEELEQAPSCGYSNKIGRRPGQP